MTQVDDEERDRVARLLSEQVGAGRLTLAEFDQRAAHAYAARSREELDGLVADLPVTPPDAAPPGRAVVVPAGLGVLAVVLIVVGVSAVSPVLLAVAVCAALACLHRGGRRLPHTAGNPTTRGCC